MHLDRPLVCFNSTLLDRELSRIPEDATDVYLHIGGHVTMIDHNLCDGLMQFAEEYGGTGRGRVEIVGMDRLVRWSHSSHGVRLAPISGNGQTKPVTLPEDSFADVQPAD